MRRGPRRPRAGTARTAPVRLVRRPRRSRAGVAHATRILPGRTVHFGPVLAGAPTSPGVAAMGARGRRGRIAGPPQAEGGSVSQGVAAARVSSTAVFKKRDFALLWIAQLVSTA